VELANYGGSDPLEVWRRFIKWVQEAYPGQGQKSQLLPLLERCTREFKDDSRYVDSQHYLKMWVLYVRFD
jgi:hypothetical protein